MGMLALALAVLAMATSGGALPPAPAPLPECWMSDAPEFITILKTHIKSTNKEGVLDCSGQDGIVDEICKYNSDKNYDPGDTNVVINWNECGIISFTCSNINTDDIYFPDILPAEITDLDLTNGHTITGTCTENTTVYIIAIAIAVAVIAILALAIYCFCCRNKGYQAQSQG